MEDLDGSNIEIQPVLLDNMDFLSGSDRIPNSVMKDNLELIFVILLLVFPIVDLFIKIKKRRNEGQKYWHLMLILMFLASLLILFVIL